MGFSLRNMLDEAIAQVNPWDNGQTASTVAAQRRQQPMPTYNAPNPLRVVSQPMQQPQLVDNTPQPVQPPAPTFHLNVAPAAPAPHLYAGDTQIQADPNATTGVADPGHPGMLKSMYNSVVNPLVQTGKYVVDSGALGLSELSHNNDAINIAKQQQDDAFKQSMAPMIDRTGHMLAESNPVARVLGITPMDLQSKTIDANTQDLINKGATPEQAQNYNTAAKNKLYQDTLNNAGFTDTTSTKDMYLKALGDIGGTASLFIAPEAGVASAGAKTALIDGVEQAVTRTAAQKLASTGITAAEQGLMNGGASMATAAGNDASISDTLKAGATGFLTAAAMTGAGAGLKAGTPKIISMAKDAADNIHPLDEVGAIPLPKIITQAKDAVSQTAHDIITGKPNRSISEEELASAAKVRDAAQGHSDAMGLSDQDMTNYYNVMKKAGGQGANDVKAVDDALAARQTYNTRQEYMNSPEVKQGGYVKNPFADPENTDSLIEKGKQSLGTSKDDPVAKAVDNENKFKQQIQDMRTKAGDDNNFYENTILNNVEASGDVGNLARHIARRVEAHGENPTDVLDEVLQPTDLKAEAAARQTGNLSDLKQTLRSLEKSTGQKGLYNKVAQQMAGMNEAEQVNYLGKHLMDMRQKGVLAMDHVNKQAGAVEPSAKAEAASANITKPKPTGVKDAQLQQIEKARKDAVNYAADEIMHGQSDMRNVHQEIRQAGGISKSDYENIPAHLKNKNGLPMDEMAANLGFKDDGALHDAIHNQERPLTRTQARDIAQQQLESGKHPYSADYQQIKDALAARQDQLSQYPNGKYRQVKVTDKPAKMSDAELASLSATPEGTIKPAGNKIVPVSDKTELRNAAAESKVIEDLNGNKGTDTAIQNYMDTTGVTLQKAVHDINRVAKEAGINTDLGKNPIEGKVLLPTVQEGDWKQATLNSRFVQSKELELGGKALDSYKALAPEDQLLLKQIETGTVNKVASDAKDPAAFKQAASDIRNYYDHRHAYDKALGIDVGYRTNYLRQLFDRVEEDKQATTGDEQLRGGGGNKNPGYTKQRTFDTLGADVGNALERDIKGSSFNHAKLAYEQGLNEAFPGKIANGEIPRSKNDGVYKQIDHPFGNDLSAPKDIAHEINSRVWHQNDSKALDVYDKLNHGFKYVKLSGGLFHAFTESGNFIGQQLASGKFFTDPAATGRMAKVFFSKDAMHNELTRMADHGVLDKAHLSGLTFTPREILADANVSALDKAKGAVHATAKYTGIQAMHDATFQREIPYAKLKIFEQKTAHLDPSKPADLAKMREQATAINNLFGGINREVQGMKPGTFKWVQRALLATDFTEGKIVTLAKALSDKSAAGNTARQAVAGKALLFGAIATAGAAAGGNYQGKTKYQIARDAAGNLIDPSFEMGGYKVGLPKTHISEVVDAIKPTSKNGKAWNASGLLSYAQNRSAALPSEAIQLLSNKNYYGQPLYGTNTKKNGGGKISTGQAASNIAQTVLPIPVGQAATTSAGKQNPAAAVANVIGFKAKPNTANDVSFQGVQTTLNDKQAEAYNNQANSTLKSMQQQLTSSDAYKNANPNDQSKMMSELKKNVDSSVQRDFASKNNIGQFAPDYTGKGTSANTKEQDILSGKINPDSYLPNSGNTDSYAVSQFKKSPKQTTQIGNETYYKTSDGTVKHQATFDYNMGIQSAKVDFALNRFKATGNYNAWATSAQQKYDLLQQQIDHLNPDSQQADVIKLKQQQADLVDTAQKYNSYGGFDKPKSAKSQLNKLKNSYTPYSIKTASSSNNSLRSMLANAHIASPGSGRKFTAKQIVKVA